MRFADKDHLKRYTLVDAADMRHFRKMLQESADCWVKSEEVKIRVPDMKDARKPYKKVISTIAGVRLDCQDITLMLLFHDEVCIIIGLANLEILRYSGGRGCDK